MSSPPACTSPVLILHDPDAGRWLRFQNPQEVLAAHDAANVASALSRVDQLVADGFHAAGFLSYESAPAFDEALKVQPDEGGFPRAWLGVFAPENVRSFGSLEEIRSAAGAFDLGALQASVTEHEYRETVARIKELIAAGDTYQVNFTFRLAASFEG
ncbi:MAG: hypothetical protein AAGK22_29515, partial [Acidobacteriota bacterium]